MPLDINPVAKSLPAVYTSEMLQLYHAKLDKLSGPKLVDLGPVCEENIMYFASRVKRHHVCDLFIRLHRSKRPDRQQPKQASAKKLWEHLDYPNQNFDGIHIWDFLDRLDDGQAGRLLEICHLMLKPGGILLLTGFEESAQSPDILSFVAGDNYRLSFRPQHHLELPLFYRSNRELTALMSRFRLVKSFLYRNGVREFFFQCN
jgi:hypothetical protein